MRMPAHLSVVHLAVRLAVSLLIAMVSAGWASAQSAKLCGKCGSQVSLSSSVGDSCPHCSAFWGGVKKVAVPYSLPPSPSVPGLSRADIEFQMRLNRAIQLRADTVDRRTRVREKIAARTAQARAEADPPTRAAAFCETAARFVEEGNIKAAEAMYRLACRTAPTGSPSSWLADQALVRLALLGR